MRHRRIVIADDDTDTTQLLAFLLSAEGHEVQCATDGAEAMRLFRETNPDTMLLDLSMPGINGREVARRVRKEDSRHEVLLVAVTGWATSSDAQDSLACGFDHHLAKPVDLDVVTRLLCAG